ncbi:hypothetical protein Dsin_001608 [Dipteronia sinensis]|uniref:Uncharacterized protein n=1 Tax=Dipteronia sinensis TaxID=43782 RepID=A0AAE0B4M6_9ROSI|nr:hypothetical protein Dsin_001608 [Dipteronia sinensis]
MVVSNRKRDEKVLLCGHPKGKKCLVGERYQLGNFWCNLDTRDSKYCGLEGFCEDPKQGGTGIGPFSLVPTTHRIKIYYENARYLFCAKNLLLMDVGQIIMKGIFEAKKSNVGPLPFPCLITHFCEEAGIDVQRGGWTMIPPTGNLGRRVYNDLARHKGLPPLVISRVSMGMTCMDLPMRTTQRIWTIMNRTLEMIQLQRELIRCRC